MDLIVYIVKSQLKNLFYLLLLLLKLQLQLQLKKNYFIHYYIETFFVLQYFFDILLVFASFLQTYYDIHCSHIFFFSFFILQISCYIYLLPAPLISLYYFYSNLLLYLVSNLCFFNNRLNQGSHPFLYITKKKFFF